MERNADPFEDDMPGQVFVKMEPGDVSEPLQRATRVFWIILLPQSASPA